jgi:adenylate kinase
MILMMGVAGAGKSVQGEILADKLGYKWLSSGELLRKHISGEKQQQMLEGRLLDDSELIALFDQTLMNSEERNQTVLDGFPRTLAQAKWLLDQHKNGKINIESIVLIKVSRQVVMERLLSRGRPDDTEEAINTRFEEHDKMTIPIIDLYKSYGIDVHEIDGSEPVETVSQNIAQLLELPG